LFKHQSLCPQAPAQYDPFSCFGIRVQARGTQPWFAWVAFNAGHTPLHKPPNELHSYDSLAGTQADINANPRPYFEAMIEAMDTEIGRLLAVVDRANTHILFLGDNGTTPNVLQPPYPAGRGKSTLYEGGIKVPLVIAGPAVVNPGRTNATPVHAVDLFATILELAGLSVAGTVPANVTIDSQSLLPILRDEPDVPRHVFTELFGDNLANSQDGRALRNEQFKLIRFHDGREGFYDLLADPYEATNLLAGALTATQQAHYYALTMKLADYQESAATPVITSYTRAAGQFAITVQRQAGLSYGLWRSATLQYLDWAPVTNAVAVTNGTESVTVSDPDAGAAHYFYRVLATAP
jgi:arylsulfatase A-like enzyme